MDFLCEHVYRMCFVYVFGIALGAIIYEIDYLDGLMA